MPITVESADKSSSDKWRKKETHQLVLDPTLRCATSTAQNELIWRKEGGGIDWEVRESVGDVTGAHVAR